MTFYVILYEVFGNGDTLVIKVQNNARYNFTIHWHGVRQIRTPWADGPEFLTQCPIQPGATYTYRYKIEDREGTLWWHAHSKWLRATVYGTLIIRPKLGSSYPFQQPNIEFPVVLGEWWNINILDTMRQVVFTGGAPNVSSAYTINGQPGDLYACSRQDTTRLSVSPADAVYIKPFTTNVITVGPGHTTDVLLTANQSPGRYYMDARAYGSHFFLKPFLE
ncbi:hypothetical protein POM88_024012 [Heracleum sosnowskyi]|uniref:Laccase n=1 Tax=Heracleum sosnowskyi TaxID=360622 RepID=A0AAD8IKX5_9APIA|nr:hypothetical protein POM88_024012 [Heracleum sosnowskyi]